MRNDLFHHKDSKGTKGHEERPMNAKGPRPGNANLRIGTEESLADPLAMPQNHRSAR